MASPHVSGVAGLILAAFPGISNSEVKNRILNGVDSIPGLVGRTVTGGRINAFNSLMIPSAPGSLTATAVSANRVDVRWIDNSSNEDEFAVERKAEFDAPYSLIATVPGIAGTGTSVSYNDTSVAAGIFYHYRVRARNTHGYSTYSNEAMALTPGGSLGLVGGGGGSGGGSCFVATAAYGSPYHRCIDLLRTFRDEYLANHPMGKKWIQLYYRYSPPVARLIAAHPALREGTQLMLLPLVSLSSGMVHTTTLQKGLIFCFAGGCILGIALLSKRRRAG
jgi:hypothetical protein